MENRKNALLLRIRAGDDRAFSDLCLAFVGMTESLVRRFAKGYCEADMEELRQEARLALYRAAMTYRIEETAVTFGLYARVCVRNALVSRYRKESKRLSVCSLEGVSELLLPDEGEPVNALIQEESIHFLYEKIEEALSPYEKKVFDLYVDGKSVAEIARAVGKSEKSVSNAVFRMLKKLRLAIGN